MEHSKIEPQVFTNTLPTDVSIGRQFINELVGGYPIITLCGSTKFKEDFINAQRQLTLDGYIVLSVGVFGHSGDNLAGAKHMLDDMHKRKIDLADEIFEGDR